ncbi:MAG TPA: hypothetical protein VFQ40_05025 [Actinomycetota bacterium]|nr:hypothetical protein [Actinomycetota bacterium]
MSGDLVVQTNGPYLRVVLPDFEPSWDAVWQAVAFELEEGINRAEIVAPSYHDEDSLDGVRRLVERLEGRGVAAIVEWQGVPELAGASAGG